VKLLRYVANTPQDTETFGARLAQSVPTHPSSALIVYLTGNLGAGKTTLARGFLRQLGFAGAVKSPTYTLLESYNLRDLTVVHLDLYRLQEPSELDALGLRDMDRAATVWLIEWPERAARRLPEPDVSIAFEAGDAAHVLTAVSYSQSGTAWLAKAG
jgi:tRNA threonylcarbamoyladenosine biosynthesis protein TsaE